MIRDTPDPSSPSGAGTVRARWSRDLVGVGAVVVLSLAVLGPGLLRGRYFGPVDILSSLGLTAQHGATVHNPTLRDLIALFMPFTNQGWLQVHHGHLPLWNPDTALGMPLAFNWESAPSSVPSLVGDLVPLGAAYTVGVVVTLVVSSCGGYVFGRTLRLGVLASVFTGVVFTLSGPVLSFLGWSSTSVGSWTGWLFAAVVWIVRGRHRFLGIAALGVFTAGSVYAGHPETTLLVAGGTVVFAGVALVHRNGPGRSALRAGVDVVVGLAVGLALSSPLLLPGLQFARSSGRTAAGNYSAVTVPDHPLLQLLFQSFDGSPVAGGHWFGSVAYQWTANYLGVIVLVLAALALVGRWRDRWVRALTVVVVVTGILGMARPVATALDGLPVIGSVILTRALVPFAFGLAALGGIGLDELVRNPASRRVHRTLALGASAGAVVVALVWVFGRGHLSPDEAAVRDHSFVWPALGVVSVLIALLVLVLVAGTHRRRTGVGRGAGAFLLAAQATLLIAVGAPLWSWSTSAAPPPSSAVTQLQEQIHGGLVGLGAETCIASTYFGTSELGILPEANILYGVRQFAVYDPLVPTSYFSAWRSATGTEGGSDKLYQFCPAVPTATIARRFGIGYVLEVSGHPGPTGSVYVRTIADQALYRIPGAASATLVRPGRNGRAPLDAVGVPVTVGQPDPSTWRMTTSAGGATLLRLRLTNVPGWHASLDGRPLTLRPFDGVMLEADVPAGRHHVVLTYWPASFTVGLIVAGTTALALLVVAGFILGGHLRRGVPGAEPDAPDRTPP